MRLKFFGAVGTVTGSRTLVLHKDTRILVDCGLFQGPKPLRLLNWEAFAFASTVQAVFLTHAHLDHVGALPLLMRDGFSGPIFCTPGTRELAELILLDSGRLQEEDAIYANKTGHSRHKPARPLYTEADCQKVLQQFKTIERNEWFLFGDVKVRFRNAGHIVGSAFLEIEFSDHGEKKRLVMSGDLGGEHSSIMKNRETPERADFLVLESTYGDRNLGDHVAIQDMERYLNKILPKGRVLIPAFSVGRTQEVLFLLGKLMEENRIPLVDVYLNSPMATRATAIYMRNTDDFKPEARPLLSPRLKGLFKTVESVEESQWLVSDPEPKVIVSASGMLTGGRVMHHLKEILPNPADGILFVGYQAGETKGRLLLNGIKELRVHHEPYPVRCHIGSIQTLTSHADQASLTRWAREFCSPQTQVVLNHGEVDSLFALKKHLETELKLRVTVPSLGEELSFET